jgi:hypothetical protein
MFRFKAMIKKDDLPTVFFRFGLGVAAGDDVPPDRAPRRRRRLGRRQAARTFAILNVAQAGDNVVTSTDLYGGTWTLFANTFKQLGVEARFLSA